MAWEAADDELDRTTKEVTMMKTEKLELAQVWDKVFARDEQRAAWAAQRTAE